MSTSTRATALAATAASRLGMVLGWDRVWRGRCPVCNYAKHSLAMKVEEERIALSCVACSQTAAIAAAMGVPNELLAAFKARSSNVARALRDWRAAAPAPGTMVERYLQARGLTLSIPSRLRFLASKRNWCDGEVHPTMISLVERVPDHEEEAATDLVATGAHYTFLVDRGALVTKAEGHKSKLTLGRLRHGGVWLTPLEQIANELAVAEGIETALSVRQITGLPTVAALSASGMRAFRWPPQVRTLWIAADNDAAGLAAANALLDRALRAGLQARIRAPANGKNDFNDLLRSA